MIDLAELNPASDDCQRWANGRHSWRRAEDGGFDAQRYDVASIDENTARAYVERNHYSRSYPASSRRYGLFESGALVGVAVLSVPTSKPVLTGVFPDLIPYVESLELGRLVLADAVPANAETWMLTRAFELAAESGVRGIVSFSDPTPRRAADGSIVFPGHRGIIYQAKNALYLGRATVRTLTILPDGTVLSARSMQKIRADERSREHVEAKLVGFGAARRRRGEDGTEWLHAALATIGVRTLRHRGNHRYAWTLGPKRERRAIRVLGTPGAYPKEIDIAA